jgi:CRISPR-associated protein Csb3
MEFRFKLDVYNPAEYYASLGLLELVSQQDDEVRSRFESDDTTGTNSTFMMTCKDVVSPDLKALAVTALKYANPLIAPVMVGSLELNWWMNDFKDDKRNNLKLYGGNSRPVDMLKTFQHVMGEVDGNVLQHSVKVRTGKSSFGFDTRASRDALMVGYSQKEAGDPSVIYPETEFLCAVGLQNFRPSKDSYSYYIWKRPVPVSVAHAAAVQEIVGLRQSRYTMTVEFVGQGLRAVSQQVMRT